ncbi:MFS transporter [Kitasatospora sp. McL0602]|uniref:MFS transporter n=1 Tax=Kitasatospora sp. McL0602 TaxID=3439530 RepID=UPI003F8AB481
MTTIADPVTPADGEALGAPRRLVWLLAVACGLGAANLYYCQPLLPKIAETYHASSGSTGVLVTTTQIGYALGLLLLVPLGDIVRRRRLVCVLLCLEAAALVLSALAPGLPVLLVAGTAVGLGASVVQILLPYAATIAAEHERGRVVATMLTAVLVGILLSRTIAGLVGGALGWRAMFAIAAVVALAFSFTLAKIMAATEPEVDISYRSQLRATWQLARTEPVLRRRSVIGACVFGSFGAFWATVAFLLSGSPYHYGESAIGLFALVGAAGAIASKVTGRAADAGWQRPLTGLLTALGVASFAVMWPGHSSLAWLIVAVLVMDMAVQGTHLLNMSVVYSLTHVARARIASVYMTSYFVGGALGSASGTAAYRLAGWGGVCAVGGAFMAVALLTWARDALAEQRAVPGGEG